MTEQVMPPFGGLIKLNVDDWMDLPDGPAPYYVGAKDGLFLHRRLQIGRGIVRINNWPDNYKSVGTRTGHFYFSADPIPAEIIGKIVSFFQRIFEKQKTEAAVLLTMHVETGEWGVFVPTQLVSHGGVNYVYDPQHITGGRIVVGSIHSHADFSPFHSGTDTGDAADFDGFHCTVGFINTTPKIVAMASMNKQNMHFDEDSFPALFDWNGVGKYEAPEWWDDYVGGANKRKHTPVGNELYAKFNKPTVVRTESKKVTEIRPNGAPQPYWMYQQAQREATDWGLPTNGWNNYVPSEDRYRRPSNSQPWWKDKEPEWLRVNGYVWDDNRESWCWNQEAYNATKEEREAAWEKNKGTALQITHPSASNESAAFNARKAAEHGVDWDKSGGIRVRDVDDDEREALLAWLQENRTVEHWEDSLPDELVTTIIDSNVITDEDMDYILRSPEIAGDEAYWRETFLTKAMSCVSVLRALGVDASIRMKGKLPDTNTETEWLLPEPKAQEQADAVH